MSKYFVLAAALMVLAVACNKKEETATEAAPTVEQTAPATETAPEAMPVEGDAAVEGTEAAPADEAHADHQ